MFTRKLFIAVLLSGLFLDTDISQSETTIKGAVSGVWTKDNSPYIVIEDIYIENDQSLIINPGVHVYFQDSVTFTIGEELNTSNRKHQLIAKGLETDSIVFASQETSKIWCGFNFVESADDDTIAYAVIRDIHPGTETWNYWNQWGPIAGGAIDIILSSPQIHNCSIRNNRISDFTLLNCYHANPTLSNCIITGNSGWTGESIRPPFFTTSAMLSCSESNVRVENTLVYNNHMYQFFNYTDFSLVTFINVTISKNIFSPDSELVDLTWGLMTKIYYINSIITNNNSDFNSFFGSPFPGDSILFSYSNIDTSSSFPIQWADSWAHNPFIVWQTDNISTDPLFTDTENNNFTLQVNSPCVDAGNPHTAYNDNEDPKNPGQALWPARGTVRNDMGAYGGKSELKLGNSTNVVINYNGHSKPGEFKLCENYPNPFNPETMIEYNIPKQGKVIITVFNVLGQKIRILVDSEHVPGMYRTIWDGKDWLGKPMNSGIYFYRLDSDNFHEVKRMVLLR